MSEHGQTWMECFPIKKSKIQFDKYTVVKVKDDEKLDVGIRMTDYYITDGNKKMYFKLYHYYDWPSKGTPINAWSFLTLYRQTIKKSEDKPILIQCPNGLGWTGCFALIIYTIDNIGKNYYFDLMNNLSIIRSHRNGAIQTEEQLMIAFTVIRDFYIKHVKDNNFDIYRWYGKYYKEFFNENGTGCMIKLIQNMKDKDSVEGFNYEFDKTL
uniref:Protein tyrosine phosphatase n=1 Tax=Parastrongyloides trichosuri TaxID=131310 RepID=A0A0N4Z583_PARTI